MQTNFNTYNGNLFQGSLNTNIPYVGRVFQVNGIEDMARIRLNTGESAIIGLEPNEPIMYIKSVYGINSLRYEPNKIVEETTPPKEMTIEDRMTNIEKIVLEMKDTMDKYKTLLE